MVEIKALDIALFFIILNGVFAMLGGLSVFPAGGIQGQMVGENGVITVGENMVGTDSDINIHSIISTNNTISIWGIVIAIVASGIVILESRSGSPQIVGIVAFTIVFWGSYLSAMAIAGFFYLPSEVVGLFTGINAFIFIIAVIELSTGFSTKIGGP